MWHFLRGAQEVIDVVFGACAVLKMSSSSLHTSMTLTGPSSRNTGSRPRQANRESPSSCQVSAINTVQTNLLQYPPWAPRQSRVLGSEDLGVHQNKPPRKSLSLSSSIYTQGKIVVRIYDRASHNAWHTEGTQLMSTEPGCVLMIAVTNRHLNWNRAKPE